MATGETRAGHQVPQEDGRADESWRESTTTAEETPLLGSDTSSSRSLRDGATGGGRRAAASDADSDPDPDAPRQVVGIAQALCTVAGIWVLIFLQASNMSGMTMIQSTIAGDLEANEDAMWFTTSYLIALSSLAPVIGRLSSIFSPRSLVLPVAFCVAVGALVTSQARSFRVFIFGRVLTGMGASGILTLTIILVLELTSKRRRGIFIGLTNAGFTIGLSFGAVVYGAALPAVGWRALFWIQAPFSALAGLGVYLSMPDGWSMAASAEPKDRTTLQKLSRIDYLGSLLLTLSIVLFLYGLAGEIQPLALIMSLASVVLFTAFEFFLAADPIIPLKVLSSRGILLSCFAQLGFMSARWTLLYYTPIFALAVGGYSPSVAGSILIPTNVGFGLGGLLVGWLHIRRGGSFWLACIVSLFWFALSLFGLSFVGTATSPPALFIAVVFVNGLATGASLNYTLAHLLHLSHEDTEFVTTSLLATFRGFGGSFGTAIGGGIFYRLLRGALVSGFEKLDGGDGLGEERWRLVQRLLGQPDLVFGGGLTDGERLVAMDGYALASRGTWRAAAALGILVITVQSGTGWTAPLKSDDDVGSGARAALIANEGVGEA